MTRRDMKFVSRCLIISLIALVMSIGVRVVLESGELEKLIPRSPLRDFLLFFGPLVSLMAFHYMLAVKSFGFRTLVAEGLAYSVAMFLFLAVTLSYYFGHIVRVEAVCPAWKIWGCHPAEARSPNIALAAALILAAVAAAVTLLRRESPRNAP